MLTISMDGQAYGMMNVVHVSAFNGGIVSFTPSVYHITGKARRTGSISKVYCACRVRMEKEFRYEDRERVCLETSSVCLSTIISSTYSNVDFYVHAFFSTSLDAHFVMCDIIIFMISIDGLVLVSPAKRIVRTQPEESDLIQSP